MTNYRAFTYDNRGNVTNNGYRAFNFNLANQLQSSTKGSTTNTYVYDGHNRRVKQVDSKGTSYSMYSQDGTLLYRETQSGPVNYIYLGKRLIAKDGFIPENAGDQHYHAFGSSVEGEIDDAGYTGHKFDTDLQLSYMQARYYDPMIGRFYSNDPVGYTSENPVMSFNRYLYVNNNPYKYIDPTGKYLTASEGDREQVLEYVNSQGTSEYAFNKSGFLEKVEGGKGSGGSESFSNAVDQIISNDEMGVSVFISEVASTGENVDSLYGGGAIDTFSNGSSDVFISGNSSTLNGVGGDKISVSPAEILVHELVDHALPNFKSKGGAGTGYLNVNKVRKENGQHLIGNNPHID